MIKNWLKIYWANQIKHKVYFVLTLLGLAIGLWGVLLAYLYYKEEVRYDEWNPYKKEVFIVSADLGDGDIWNLAPYPVGSVLKEENQVITDYMYLSNYQTGSIEFEGKKLFFSKALKVQANFFDFFPFELIEGRVALNEPESVLVLDSYAKELFGEQALGKRFLYEGRWFTIQGIYSFGDTRNSIAPKLLFSGMEQVVQENSANWGNYNATLYLKIEDVTQINRVSSAISDLLYNNVYAQLAKEAGKTVEEYFSDTGDSLEVFRLFSLAEQHMMADNVYNGTLERSINMKRFYILIGLSVTILVLSIVNYINLSIVQNAKRYREMGIRLVIGSKYTTIFWQLFFESCLTLFFAVGLSLVCVEFSLPALRVFLQSHLEFELVQGIKVGLVFMLAVSALLAALLLFMMRKVPKLNLLKGELLRQGRKFSLRHVMLILQFAIAGFFMIGTGIVYQQVNYMLDKDLGFKKEQVMVVGFISTKKGEDRIRLYETYKAELAKIKGVQTVGSSSLAIGGYSYNSSSITHQGVSVQVMNVGMDETFLDVMDIKIIEGRNFDNKLVSDTISSILINKHLKDKLGNEDILDKEINWNGIKFTVVGVVDNYHTSNFKSDYSPMIFFRLEAMPTLIENIQEIYLRVDPAQSEYRVKEMEKVFQEMKISDFPFVYEFMDKRFENLFKSTVQERNILIVLSSIVVFIALFGLYSLVSFNLSNQYKEIAIRKVLGASNMEQMKQLTKQYIILGLIGFGLATYPSYYFMREWLNDYVFRIELGGMDFIWPLLLLLLLTLVTVLIKVRQAVRVNVLQHIKYE